MHQLAHHGYYFDGFTLDLTRGCLLHGEEEIKLRPKSFTGLKYLVENNGRLINKDELIGAVWPDTAVTDNSLVQCLKEVREALGDDGQHYIKTVPRRGYIFEAQVSEGLPATPVAYTEEVEGVRVVIDEEEEGRANVDEGLQERGKSFRHAAVSQAISRRRRTRQKVLVISLLSIGLIAAGSYLLIPSGPKQLQTIAEFQKSISLPGNVARSKAYLAHALAAAGRSAEAERIEGELRELSKTKYVSPFDLALIHAGLGDKDRAFEWLEKAYAEGDPPLNHIGVEPRFESLRPDPRFRDLLRRMRLTP